MSATNQAKIEENKLISNVNAINAFKYRIEEESKLDTNVDNSGNSVGRYFAGGVKYVYGCHFWHFAIDNTINVLC